ncbi:MAG: hypothetical protein F2927_04115 [Actinobacteria bacterium]|uniref:Unannotated protein n=1 Tax=freshwater metagenome TaxID=449393 RepID=A0A6J6ZHI0_9ZZZZ|nr:hypothetical protein [Actinomycetota bacterium]MSZ68344.1 hypothetical protein [Actinomycetota bacterium]MTB15945.1 hypothetical protein [Actinomycetota bacterium]
MKILRGLIAALFVFVPLFILMPSSSAATTQNIILVEPPHRDYQNVFFGDAFALSLRPTGTLGLKVFAPVQEPRTWLIDAALIDEVQTLSAKNSDAQKWLDQLKLVSITDSIIAVPYAHPDLTLTKRLAPTELNYYFEFSKNKLQEFFGRDVIIDKTANWSNGKAKISSEAASAYTYNRRALVFMNTVIPSIQLDDFRSRLAYLLSSGMSVYRQSELATSANLALVAEKRKLRIIGGNYRLTSSREKVPVTLVNDFDVPLKISLHLMPQTSRIELGDIGEITLEAHSKTQVLIPVTVIASGTTTVIAEFRNNKGKTFNDISVLTLSLSVISPAVAWFTTGAALMLFLAAVAQSVRRVRRSRR